MDHGRILALDTPAALKASVGVDSVVTVKIDGSPSPLIEALADQIGASTKIRPMEAGLELQVRDRTGLLPKLVAAAEHVGTSILDISVSEPTLETVFIDLTGKELRD